MKKYLKFAGGSILLPIFFVVYVYDRLISVPMVWIKSESMVDWFRDTNKITNSVIRAGVVGLIMFLIWLVS